MGYSGKTGFEESEEEDFEAEPEPQKHKGKAIKKIVEERTHLIAELFSKPPKKRRREIEKRILELDKEYISLQE